MIQGISNPYEAMNKLDSKQNEMSRMNDDVFTGVFNAAKELVKVTNEADKEVAALTYDFMTGKNENIHGLMVAQEKSSILLQFTMQVRNNVLEAYREIMRLPV